MDPTSLLKSLELNTWYKVVMCLGFVLIVVGLTVDVRVLTNGETLLFGAGLVLFGLGEWKNYKNLSWIEPPNAYTGPAALVQIKVRQSDTFGLLLDGLGLVALIVGVWKLVERTVL